MVVVMVVAVGMVMVVVVIGMVMAVVVVAVGMVMAAAAAVVAVPARERLRILSRRLTFPWRKLTRVSRRSSTSLVEEKFEKYFGYLARCEENFGI